MVDAQLVFSSFVGRVVESIQYHGWTVVGVLLLFAVFKNDLRAFLRHVVANGHEVLIEHTVPEV